MGIKTRIDAITGMTPEYRKAKLPAPKSVKIELTGRCNYRCGFCALRTRTKQPKTDMDFELFCNITRQMRQAGVEEIGVFYLGESCMNPGLLVDAIAWCKKVLEMPYVFLTTNGSLCTPGLMAQMFEAGLDSLKFSMNAADAEQFGEVMAVSEKLFHQSLENIKMARIIRKAVASKCGIYASSIMYDGAQQERMEGFLSKHVIPFVDEHYYLPLYSMGSLATKREEELGYRPIAGNQGRLENLRDPLPCWSCFTEGHVTAQGKLSACCFDADSRWTMGDLTTTPFMEAWNSQLFQDLRTAHLKKDVTGTICEECVAYV